MPYTVKDFLQTPNVTILPLEMAGVPALPLAQHMVGGAPYPHSAQTKLAHWNRVTGNNIPMPVGVVYNAPKRRMVQT
jgi:hypothetical protein